MPFGPSTGPQRAAVRAEVAATGEERTGPVVVPSRGGPPSIEGPTTVAKGGGAT